MRQLEKQRRRLESRGIYKDLATLRNEWEEKRRLPFPVSETSFNEEDDLDDDDDDDDDDEIDVENDEQDVGGSNGHVFGDGEQVNGGSVEDFGQNNGSFDTKDDQVKRRSVPNVVEEKKPLRGGHSAFSIDNLLSHALEKNFKQ